MFQYSVSKCISETEDYQAHFYCQYQIIVERKLTADILSKPLPLKKWILAENLFILIRAFCYA